jgi:MoaA/NifB/PqqE/SkfB family radical SAM enzyme
MTKVNDQESFDGIPVTVYDGKFAGSFDLAEEVGEKLKFDDVVSFVATAAVSKVNMGTVAKTGDMKRSNTFEVLNVLPIDPEVAKAFFEAGGAVAPQDAAQVLAAAVARAEAQVDDEEEEEYRLFELEADEQFADDEA